MSQGNFRVGDVSGVGHAIGHGAQSNVTMGAKETAELKSLLSELRDAIKDAPIPETAKAVMLNKAVPAMETVTAATPEAPEGDPKAAVRSGLERISDQLEGIGAAGEKVVKIAEVAKKIAGVVGLGLSVAAPFLGRLIGR